MKSVIKLASECNRRNALNFALRGKLSPGKRNPAVSALSARIAVRLGTNFCAFMQQQMEAWDSERRKSFKQIDPVSLARTPKLGGSSFAPAWAVEIVPDEPLQALQEETVQYLAELAGSGNQRLASTHLATPLRGGIAIFGIGKETLPHKANYFDGYRGSLKQEIITARPGGQMPGNLLLSPYDVRAFKYLYAINRFGLHLLREMTPCDATTRGFPGHPQVAQCAAAGGEAFFTASDKVVINLGSARYPVENAGAIDAVARYFLACGMNEVTAVFTARDLSVEPYSLKDRYGENLPNKVYRRACPIAILDGVSMVEPL